MRTTDQACGSITCVVACAIEEHPNPQSDPDFLRFTRWLFPVLLILSPTLGMNIDGFGFCVAMVFWWVGDVTTQSLIPCSDP
jgi:hypothetical protein